MVKEVHKRPVPKDQIKSLKTQIGQLQAQLAQTNLSLMNMRQLYEGAITEKNSFRAQMLKSNAIITALVVQARGKRLVLKEASLQKLAEYAGYDPQPDEQGNLILTPISREDVEQEEADESAI